MAAEDVCEVGFEEGMLWLPSHVLDEACDTKVRVLLLHGSCFSWLLIVCEVVCCTRFFLVLRDLHEFTSTLNAIFFFWLI